MTIMFDHDAILIYPDTISPMKHINFQPSPGNTGKYQQPMLPVVVYFLILSDPASVFLVYMLMKELLFDRTVAEGCNNDKLDLYL